MKLRLPTAAFCLTCVVLSSTAAADDLPSPWQHQDIGAVTVPGTARAAEGVFTLQGTLDIWGNSDGCHFAWQKLTGDCVIVARVLSVENTQGHAKGGVAIRESLADDAKQASMVDTPADGTQFLVREEIGGKTTSQKTGLNKGTMPYWVKLVRQGDQLTGYESLDGRDWKQTGAATLKMADEVYVGLVASSHVKDKLCAAKFDTVSITKGDK
jgi:regulation of enolase protein 1 (concanavalin A-like superfamily)